MIHVSNNSSWAYNLRGMANTLKILRPLPPVYLEGPGRGAKLGLHLHGWALSSTVVFLEGLAPMN